MRHPMRLETREVRSRRARTFHCRATKIVKRAEHVAVTRLRHFALARKGKIEPAGDCFGSGQQTTRLNLDLTLNAEHQFGGE
jgi:hypothetical protein